MCLPKSIDICSSVNGGFFCRPAGLHSTEMRARGKSNCADCGYYVGERRSLFVRQSTVETQDAKAEKEGRREEVRSDQARLGETRGESRKDGQNWGAEFSNGRAKAQHF